MAADDSTTIGRPGKQGEVIIPASSHDNPGLIRLQCYNAAGTLVERYLWIDSDGVLRINATVPTDQDADGTVVGAQT